MGKTLIYLLLLAILGAGVYFFVFRENENNFSEAEAGFKFKDTSAIHQIFIARTNGTSIDLQRTDSGWVANGRYQASTNTVNIILRTLKRQEARYPVPEVSHNVVVREIAGNGIKVELYDAEGEKMRTFYVGADAPQGAGTYMLIEGAKRPYVVQLPSFTGTLKPIYSTDITDWRSRKVIAVADHDIKSVAIEYPFNPVNSFSIQQNGSITMSADASVTGGKPLNEQRVKTFLKQFSNVNCEGFLVSIPGMDSMLKVMPNFCNINMVTKQGKQQEVKIFYMPINKRSKNQTTGIPEKYDPDRYYAVFNAGQDTAIIQQYSFGKFFRAPAEFYQADSTTTSAPATK